jgi:hypothetical protein
MLFDMSKKMEKFGPEPTKFMFSTIALKAFISVVFTFKGEIERIEFRLFVEEYAVIVPGGGFVKL